MGLSLQLIRFPHMLKLSMGTYTNSGFVIPNLRNLNARHSSVLFREFPFVLIIA